MMLNLEKNTFGSWKKDAEKNFYSKFALLVPYPENIYGSAT
jgi:hypothetical protein